MPGVLAGKDRPRNPAENCGFAQLCAQPFQKRYAEASRLYGEAFAADSKLADDLKSSNRYDASCYAARAAGGEGIDAPADEAARAALRQKALGWLRADLDLRRKQADSAVAADRALAAATLAQWLTDPDPLAVRDAEPLAKLPTVEREAWQRFWADVKATLAEARKPVPSAKTDAGKK